MKSLKIWKNWDGLKNVSRSFEDEIFTGIGSRSTYGTDNLHSNG
ncbi:MAG: hypothetical protein ABR574_05970 [Cryomorphaceae bacterium]